MEKYSYNSYPDSAGSSPRSREIEFENPPPWDDQQQPQNCKAKFLCSYGGKIQPRPHDNQLAYVGGETKILAVDRGIRFASMISKLAAICGGEGGSDVSFKYQLPGEDLDALISVTNDDDLEHMMHEYDRLIRSSSKPARMRLFLFPVSSSSAGEFGSGGSSKSDRDRFVEALNSGPSRSENEKPVTVPPSNADFLFGSEKGPAVPPSVPIAVNVPESTPEAAAIGAPPALPDHIVNPGELQRQWQEFQKMQIRDHEQQQQQQEALFRRKSEDSHVESGGYYASPTIVQNPPQPAPTVQQMAAPPGYWQGKHIQGGVFPAPTTPGLPEQPVYVMQAPGTVYHAPPPTVVRPVTGQPNQGYYPNLQRMPPEQPAYNVVQPPVGTQAPPPQPYSAAPPPFSAAPPHSAPPGRPVSGGGAMGLTETSYAPVYYTAPGGGVVVPPQQYQGTGVTFSGSGELRAVGQDGKVVSKVSQGSL